MNHVVTIQHNSKILMDKWRTMVTIHVVLHRGCHGLLILLVQRHIPKCIRHCRSSRIQATNTEKMMSDVNKALALIPARGGSVGVPRKILRHVNDVPLITWTIRAALKSAIFSRVCVSSDSQEILDVASQEGAHVHLRSCENASSTASTESVIVEFSNI